MSWNINQIHYITQKKVWKLSQLANALYIGEKITVNQNESLALILQKKTVFLKFFFY